MAPPMKESEPASKRSVLPPLDTPPSSLAPPPPPRGRGNSHQVKQTSPSGPSNGQVVVSASRSCRAYSPCFHHPLSEPRINAVAKGWSGTQERWWSFKRFAPPPLRVSTAFSHIQSICRCIRRTRRGNHQKRQRRPGGYPCKHTCTLPDIGPLLKPRCFLEHVPSSFHQLCLRPWSLFPGGVSSGCAWHCCANGHPCCMCVHASPIRPTFTSLWVMNPVDMGMWLKRTSKQRASGGSETENIARSRKNGHRHDRFPLFLYNHLTSHS